MTPINAAADGADDADWLWIVTAVLLLPGAQAFHVSGMTAKILISICAICVHLRLV
jgi:hypothetical protein